jgi:hypothetical protein
MKILMVAVFNNQSTNNSQARGFENNGCSVIQYNYRQRGANIGNDQRDSEIISICNSEKPHLVFFSKCNDVNVRVVKECNKMTKTVLWYMDPFNKNFDDELREKIKYSSYTFCALTEPYKEAKKLNPNTVFFLQEGFDELVNYPMNVPYINDVSFIGALRNERMDYYNALQFKIYNNSFNEEHSKAVSETKINLNFTEGGTSDRTYKVLASKGFLLTQPWAGMESDFEIDKDLVIFQTIAELRLKINFYLRNEKERLKIAAQGWKTVQKFNRTNFARKIIEISFNNAIKI